MNFKIFESEREWLNEMGRESDLFVDDSLKNKEKLFIGLAGGTTPCRFYQELAEKTFWPWEKLFFVTVDERYVSREELTSNYAMIVKNLFSKFKDSRYFNNFIFYKTEIPVKDCLEDFENQLATFECKNLDLCYLGVGADGHFASIFPDTDLKNDKQVWATETKEHDIAQRLTLSPKFILSSKKIMVMLKGPEKLAIVEKLKNGVADENFPARLLNNHPDCTVYYFKG